MKGQELRLDDKTQSRNRKLIECSMLQTTDNVIRRQKSTVDTSRIKELLIKHKCNKDLEFALPQTLMTQRNRSKFISQANLLLLSKISLHREQSREKTEEPQQ